MAQPDKIEVYDVEDYLLPPALPFKRNIEKRRVPPKRLKQVVTSENYQNLPASTPTFANIEAPPSVYPAKHYCDLTGFEAPYTDPRTRLRYASAPLFAVCRTLPSEQVHAFLAARGANVVLK